MTTHAPLTRRSLLRASPTLLAPLTLSTCGTELLSAPAETPVMALYGRHRALFARAEEPGLTEGEFQRAFDLMHEVEEQMLAEPVTTAADLAAKVLVLTQLCDSPDDTPHTRALLEEMETLVAAALA